MCLQADRSHVEGSTPAESVAVQAVSSSTRGCGLGSLWPGLPWECQAGQSRQVRPEEAQEPCHGRLHGAACLLKLVLQLTHAAAPHLPERRSAWLLTFYRGQQRGQLSLMLPRPRGRLAAHATQAVGLRLVLPHRDLL